MPAFGVRSRGDGQDCPSSTEPAKLPEGCRSTQSSQRPGSELLTSPGTENRSSGPKLAPQSSQRPGSELLTSPGTENRSSDPRRLTGCSLMVLGKNPTATHASSLMPRAPLGTQHSERSTQR